MRGPPTRGPSRRKPRSPSGRRTERPCRRPPFRGWIRAPLSGDAKSMAGRPFQGHPAAASDVPSGAVVWSGRSLRAPALGGSLVEWPGETPLRSCDKSRAGGPPIFGSTGLSWKPGAFGRNGTSPVEAREPPPGKGRTGSSDPDRFALARPDADCCDTPVVPLRQPATPQCIRSGGCKCLRAFVFGRCGPFPPHGSFGIRDAVGRRSGPPGPFLWKAQSATDLLRVVSPSGAGALPVRAPRGCATGLFRELRRQCRTRSRQEQAQGSIGRTCVATCTARYGFSGC